MNVLVRNLDADVVDRLRARAERFGRSLQSELKMLIEEAARDEVAAEAFRKDLDALRSQIRTRRGNRKFSDSAKLIRRMRDER